jgi:hypothetical protein
MIIDTGAAHSIISSDVAGENCDSHFLIYANMARPASREDWLLDQYKLGFEFSIDRTTVMMREWGVTDATLKPVFYRYARFFNLLNFRIIDLSFSFFFLFGWHRFLTPFLFLFLLGFRRERDFILCFMGTPALRSKIFYSTHI